MTYTVVEYSQEFGRKRFLVEEFRDELVMVQHSYYRGIHHSDEYTIVLTLDVTAQILVEVSIGQILCEKCVIF